jgi:hypothetical protein
VDAAHESSQPATLSALNDTPTLKGSCRQRITLCAAPIRACVDSLM